MTESIKHGIVLLQIAKNATLPEVQFKAKQSADQEQSVSPKQRLKDSTISIFQNDFGVMIVTRLTENFKKVLQSTNFKDNFCWIFL